MKTIAELNAIREQRRKTLDGREGGNPRIVVGMATCGIAAGARRVMQAFSDELAKRGLQNVSVTQTGCIGMCRMEPMADVTMPGRERVTYVKLRPEMIPRIVAEHIVNGRPVTEYTVGAAEGK